MKKYYLILGNITFHHFAEEELKLFSNPESEQKALVHDYTSIRVFDTEDEANEAGENGLEFAESYVVVNSFKGEVYFENGEDRKRFDDLVAVVEPEELIDYIILSEDDKWLGTGKQETEKQLKEELERIKGENPDTELIVFKSSNMESFSY